MEGFFDDGPVQVFANNHLRYVHSIMKEIRMILIQYGNLEY